MTFDLEAFCNSFNPTTTNPDSDRPSPDFNDPVMAHKLMHEVPKLAFGIGLRPPYGWDESDFMAELQLTLILRSRGKGKWDPARGRAKWSSWACMVMQTRSQNLHRSAVSSKANLVRLCSIEQMNMNTLEGYDGEGIGVQNGVPKWQRTAKAAQQRERRAEQQRARRAQASAAGVPLDGGA